MKKGTDGTSNPVPRAVKTYHPGAKSTGFQVKLPSVASTTPSGTGSNCVALGRRLGALLVEIRNVTSSSGPKYVHLIVLDAQVFKGEKGPNMKEADGPSSGGVADAV
ncbi:hypothetical protein TRAPUB_828 [Trametes pubescens]|uniref:Uncharacterized protein n=1 Tax=Trametes pubescens TaxID=154538 RepID=A0A1M2VL14_TRAPU|nr:hypothetical protein TRAPUB_828 [Trametes pubescens]